MTTEVLTRWVDLGPGPTPGGPVSRSALTAGRRRRSERTRRALRVALQETFGLVDITLGYEPAGRPVAYVAGQPVGVSVSRSGALGVVAVCPWSAVGIDVEQAERDVDHLAIARRFFAAAEYAELLDLGPGPRRRRFFELWTWKEAVAKATGVGLRSPLVPTSMPGPACRDDPVRGADHAHTSWPRAGVVLTVVTGEPGPRPVRAFPPPVPTVRRRTDPDQQKAGLP